MRGARALAAAANSLRVALWIRAWAWGWGPGGGPQPPWCCIALAVLSALAPCLVAVPTRRGHGGPSDQRRRMMTRAVPRTPCTACRAVPYRRCCLCLASAGTRPTSCSRAPARRREGRASTPTSRCARTRHVRPCVRACDTCVSAPVPAPWHNLAACRPAGRPALASPVCSRTHTHPRACTFSWDGTLLLTTTFLPVGTCWRQPAAKGQERGPRQLCAQRKVSHCRWPCHPPPARPRPVLVAAAVVGNMCDCRPARTP